MSQMSVVMGPERRRRWRPEEKLALVAEAFGKHPVKAAAG
jgi:transposase-like protein